MPATRQTSDVNRNKFNAADMPEIRHVRSALLKSLKLVKKTQRLDRITKAILPDIDWKKLSVNIPTTEQSIQTSIDDLNSSILNFRSSMAEQLEHIMCSIATGVEQQARTSASSSVIFEAASTMARKYNARDIQKSSTRPRHQASTTPLSNTTPSPRPAKPSTKTTQSPRRPSPSYTQNSNLQPSTSTSQRPLQNKPSTKASKMNPVPAKSAPTPSTTTTSRRTRSTKKKNNPLRSLSPSTQRLIQEETLRLSQRTEEEIEAHGRAYIERFHMESLQYQEKLQSASPFNPGLD